MAANAAAAASLLAGLSAPAAIQQLTAACDAFDVTGSKEAEQYLLAFQSLPRPFELTRHALHTASSARLLHLALTVHVSAALRLWRLLSGTERQRETEALLWFVDERASSQQAYVLSQSAHAAATLLRRHWLDGAGGAEWANYRLQQLVARRFNPATAQSNSRVTVDVVHSLVTDMSLPSRSWLYMGVTAASVVAAHSSFERTALLPLFSGLVQMISALLPSISTSPDSADMAVRCVRAMEGCLTWNFSIDSHAALRYLSSATSETEAELGLLSSPLQLPVHWRPVLLERDVLHVLAQCDRQLLAAHRCTLDALLCLVPLTSLHGAVFAQQSDQARFMDSLTQQTCDLLDSHLQWALLQNKGRSMDGKLLSVAHSVLSGVLSSLSFRGLLALPSFALWLSALSHMARSVLQDESFARSSFTSGTDTALAECLHALLATWAELAIAVHDERQHDDQRASSRAAALDLIEQQASQLFAAYIGQRLKREVIGTIDVGDGPRAEEALDDETEEEEQFAGADNEHDDLVSVAFLARPRPTSSLEQYQPLLAHFVHRYATLLSSTSPASSVSSKAVLSCCDQLLFLVDLLSCILTDSAAGEAAVIPSMLLFGLRDSTVVEGPLQSAATLLALIAEVVRAGCSSRLSPTLAVGVLSLFHRVNSVYVDIDSSQSLYSQPSSVRPLLLSPGCLSRVVSPQLDAAASFLMLWAGEQDVHDAALRSLVPLLTQPRSHPYAATAGGYETLHRLLQSARAPFFVSSSSSSAVSLTSVDGLSSATQSLLVSVLSRSCNDVASLAALMAPIESRLLSVLDGLSTGAASWLAESTHVVYCTSCVSLLRGLSDSTNAASFDAIFALLSARWSDLTALMRAAVEVLSAAPVVNATLALLVSEAEHQMSYMDAAQSSRFMVVCADAVSQYLHAMQRRANALHDRVARVEVDLLVDSFEEDMALLLRLLSELVRDDAWSAGLDSVERAGELCVAAVTTLASDPLFMRLLATSAQSASSSFTSDSSRIVSLFFSLLHDAMTTHTGRVCALPSAARARLVALLLHFPSPAGRQCMQSVAALAAHHTKQQRGGGNATQTPKSPPLEADVALMLRQLLTTLISQPVPPGMIEPMSDALLACCVAVPQRIGELVSAVISDWRLQQPAAGRSKSDDLAAELAALQHSLAQLVTSNGVRADSTMDNKRRMRINVLHFINAVKTSTASIG